MKYELERTTPTEYAIVTGDKAIGLVSYGKVSGRWVANIPGTAPVFGPSAISAAKEALRLAGLR